MNNNMIIKPYVINIRILTSSLKNFLFKMNNDNLK